MVSPTDEVQPERGTSSCLRGMQTRIACMQASKHINTKNLEVSKPNGWSAYFFFCEFKIHLLRIIFLYVCVVCVYYAECMYLAVRACLCPCTWDVMTAFNFGHTKKQKSFTKQSWLSDRQTASSLHDHPSLSETTNFSSYFLLFPLLL